MPCSIAQIPRRWSAVTCIAAYLLLLAAPWTHIHGEDHAILEGGTLHAHFGTSSESTYPETLEGGLADHHELRCAESSPPAPDVLHLLSTGTNLSILCKRPARTPVNLIPLAVPLVFEAAVQVASAPIPVKPYYLSPPDEDPPRSKERALHLGTDLSPPSV